MCALHERGHPEMSMRPVGNIFVNGRDLVLYLESSFSLKILQIVKRECRMKRRVDSPWLTVEPG